MLFAIEWNSRVANHMWTDHSSFNFHSALSEGFFYMFEGLRWVQRRSWGASDNVAMAAVTVSAAIKLLLPTWHVSGLNCETRCCIGRKRRIRDLVMEGPSGTDVPRTLCSYRCHSFSRDVLYLNSRPISLWVVAFTDQSVYHDGMRIARDYPL